MSALSILVLVAGCALGGGREVDRTPIAGAWTADVREFGDDGHGGFATVTILPAGGTRANLTLSGGSAGGSHPWHIHSGLCGEPGDPVGEPDDYPLLEPNDRGNASATATVETTLDSDTEYHIDIHQSAEDDSVVGCGDLVSTG